MSYRSAKRLRQRIRTLSETADRIAEPASRALRLCGHGRRHNWSTLIADALFVDCACCLIWRGMAIGLGIGISVTLIAVAAIRVAM